MGSLRMIHLNMYRVSLLIHYLVTASLLLCHIPCGLCQSSTCFTSDYNGSFPGSITRIRTKHPYSMKSCPFVLRRHNCINNFLYELRPSSCSLLPTMALNWSALLGNRTLWVLGDSLSSQLSISIMCLLRKFSDMILYSLDGSGKLATGSREDMASKIILEKSRCAVLHRLNSRICFRYVSQLPDPGWLSTVFNLIKKHDIVLLNIGIHFNRENLLSYRNNISAVSTFLNGLSAKPRVYWIESTTQPFGSGNGLYSVNARQSTNKCSALPEDGWPLTNWRNLVANPVLQRIKIPIVPFAIATKNAQRAHRGSPDCTHFCNPGLVDSLAVICVTFVHEHMRSIKDPL
jgi:hypothetical protein